MKAKHCALKTCMLNEPRSQGPQNCGNFRDQDVYGPELLWVFGVFGVLEGGEAVGSTFATWEVEGFGCKEVQDFNLFQHISTDKHLSTWSSHGHMVTCHMVNESSMSLPWVFSVNLSHLQPEISTEPSGAKRRRAATRPRERTRILRAAKKVDAIPIGYHRIHGAGIHTNIGGILMVNVTICYHI